MTGDTSLSVGNHLKHQDCIKLCNLTELYDRPCFAACAKCGEHGAIIFEDGSLSEMIFSIEAGLDMIEILLKSGKITESEYDRILSQLVSSDLPDKLIIAIPIIVGSGGMGGLDPSRN